ncbi:ribonuclease MRP protein subunit POP4-like [Phragmites australis]|uniref:ribonuclease MRP protein subunit POP4-like n=1 Tax=Phragmites australis TaxID=29695 RepID=UPI002D792E89|nr:ribonuclease MRP protein subunit POP4-like [Phragmites australis]XP_062179897.1 ribonuclease MRP protein subunit POP4-like [Phragmites australis]XP_062179898.1 ribonuclease MRP protein subunit POP4-like [Phragmites australis]
MSTISDQKKRTLEALKQQHAAAKAKKLQDEQLKCQKKNHVNTPKPKFDAPRKGKVPEFTPCRTSAQPTSNKGVAFSSSSRQQKPSTSSGEESNPVYAELSCAIHDNLFQDGISELDSTEVVRSVIYDIIQKGGDTGKITKGAKKLKLEKGILLDNYVRRGPRLVDAQARSLLIQSKRSKRHMSLKQHKKCGSFDLDGTFHKFDLYKPMHEMWKEYIRELNRISPKKQLPENLLSADLHGALLIVAECKAASYQGVSGIMIRDTAETFGIISEDNHFRVVPKVGSVFILQADCWKVTLIGDKLSPKEKSKDDQHQQRAQSLIR